MMYSAPGSRSVNVYEVLSLGTVTSGDPRGWRKGNSVVVNGAAGLVVQMREMEVSEEAVTMRSRGLSSSVDQNKQPILRKFHTRASIYWN